MKHRIPTPLEFIKSDMSHLREALSIIREERALAFILLMNISLFAFLWFIVYLTWGTQ